MNKNKKSGFTLIELMIVVAIIGILASIALPAYQIYVSKSIINSLHASAGGGKSAMLTRYIELGEMPEDGTGLGEVNETDSATAGLYGVLNTSKYQSSLSYIRNSDTSAEFKLTLANVNGNLNGEELSFIYKDTDGAFTLTCKISATVSLAYLPKHCGP